MYGRNISIKEMYFRIGFKRLYKKLHSPPENLEILSVQNSASFNTQLAVFVPDCAQISRVQHGLRDFRGKQRFDLIFYSPSPETAKCFADLLEDLCFCRILLRPGALLFLPVQEKKAQWATGWFTKKQRQEMAWLRQAGFTNITVQKMGIDYVLVGGQRSAQRF